MYGVADPFNDGPAILSHDIADNKEDAARWADQLAEWYAENERDYRRVNGAGFRYRELADEISTARKAALELCRERREIRAVVPAHAFPASCEALTSAIKAEWRAIKKARRERGRIFSDYGMCEGFNDE